MTHNRLSHKIKDRILLKQKSNENITKALDLSSIERTHSERSLSTIKSTKRMLKKCGDYRRSGSKPDLRISMIKIENEVPPVKVVKVDLPGTVR